VLWVFLNYLYFSDITGGKGYGLSGLYEREINIHRLFCLKNNQPDPGGKIYDPYEGHRAKTDNHEPIR
jgi:hypothetical protein